MTRWTWAPLPLRLMLGIGFLYHGLPKLSAEGHQQIVAMIQGMGLFAPEFWGWVVAIAEVVGGLFLIFGFLTRIISVVLSIHMLVAAFAIHLPAGFNFINIRGMTPEGPQFGLPGYEVNLLYIAGLLALAIGGAGALSVDRFLWERKRSRVVEP